MFKKSKQAHIDEIDAELKVLETNYKTERNTFAKLYILSEIKRLDELKDTIKNDISDAKYNRAAKNFDRLSDMMQGKDTYYGE